MPLVDEKYVFDVAVITSVLARAGPGMQSAADRATEGMHKWQDVAGGRKRVVVLYD